MTRRVLVLRHDPGIGLGNVRGTLESRGFAITTLDTPALEPGFLGALDPGEWDLLVALGGTEGAYEGDQHPYLDAEIDLLAKRAALGKPILAICLGAQQLAMALGARAYRGRVHEVGFVPISLTDAGETSPLRHIGGTAMVQWHHDTFDLPDGVELLASTPDYPQAYRAGPWLLAVQFHPEVDEQIFDGWVARWSSELTSGVSARDLLEAKERHLDAAQRASRSMVGEWLDGFTA
mgnify:CR=1 FL=1